MCSHGRHARPRQVNARVAVTLLFALASSGAAGCTRALDEHSDRATLVRLGWQTPWATQGQIVQALKHTNALSNNGLRGQFEGFSYGGPLNEAALANRVDVVFTADQPASVLVARTADWVIVSRLMLNRVAVYVPPESPIRSLRDLRGKTIAMPFGAAAQREAFRALSAAGLDPRRDVRLLNLDIYEQGSVIRAGNLRSWGTIDAMAGFDPTPALLEHEGLARMLHVGEVISVVAMNRRFAMQQDLCKRFLKAFVQAYYFYATHQEEADRWFQEESRLKFSRDVLATAAAVEPNVRARRSEDIDVMLTDGQIRRLQEASDFLYEQKLTSRRVIMRDHVDQRALSDALTELRRDPRGFEAIRVSDDR